MASLTSYEIVWATARRRGRNIYSFRTENYVVFENLNQYVFNILELMETLLRTNIL
jgi:hypothetical protein